MVGADAKAGRIPTVTGKTETPAGGSISVSGPMSTHRGTPARITREARAARGALEADLQGLPDLAGRLNTSMLDRLEAYVDLLLAANEHFNLTRVTQPIDVARTHLLDALAALPYLDDIASSRAIDIGSGGGLPAIPIAIARPDLSWLLVESVGKKARALSDFVDELRVPAVQVVAERAETVGRDPGYRETAGLVTARAVAALPVLAELAIPLLAPGGRLLAWKGPLTPHDGELRQGARAAALLGGGPPELLPAGIPQLGGHTFVRVAKRRPTPDHYPRRPGEPARRPLG